MKLGQGEKGMWVRYIPAHAEGDKHHKDCEDGYITSVNNLYIFVRYVGHENSQATRPEDLVRRYPKL